MRSEFEKLPEINNRLSQGGIYWNGSKYDTLPFMSHFISTAIFLNGAWYTYQEQQKKINEALKILSTMRHNGAHKAIMELKNDTTRN